MVCPITLRRLPALSYFKVLISETPLQLSTNLTCFSITAESGYRKRFRCYLQQFCNIALCPYFVAIHIELRGEIITIGTDAIAKFKSRHVDITRTIDRDRRGLCVCIIAVISDPRSGYRWYRISQSKKKGPRAQLHRHFRLVNSQ